MSTLGAPWTDEQQFTSHFSTTGLQIATASGGSYIYGPTVGNLSAGWVGMIATIAATGGAGATPPRPIMACFP